MALKYRPPYLVGQRLTAGALAPSSDASASAGVSSQPTRLVRFIATGTERKLPLGVKSSSEVVEECHASTTRG